MANGSSTCTVNEVMQAIKALTKVVAAKETKSSQRFPHLCRNGTDCKWLACGMCWFQHGHDCADRIQKDVEVKEQKPDDITDSMETKLKELEHKFEQRINSLSHHVERLVGEMSEKLDALAEATFKNETDIEEVRTYMQTSTAVAIDKGSDIENKNDGILSELHNKVDELETTFEAKLEDGLNGIRILIQATVKVFSTEVANKIHNLEDHVANLKGLVRSPRSVPPSVAEDGSGPSSADKT
jgi:uncharacterized protein YqgV (UPF0045/DUF77 family)